MSNCKIDIRKTLSNAFSDVDDLLMDLDEFGLSVESLSDDEIEKTVLGVYSQHLGLVDFSPELDGGIITNSIAYSLQKSYRLNPTAIGPLTRSIQSALFDKTGKLKAEIMNRESEPDNIVIHTKAISQGLYYKWSKDFMEAGKKRLNEDSHREAITVEVSHLKSENITLKELVAELSLENRHLKNKSNGDS